MVPGKRKLGKQPVYRSPGYSYCMFPVDCKLTTAKTQQVFHNYSIANLQLYCAIHTQAKSAKRSITNNYMTKLTWFTQDADHPVPTQPLFIYTGWTTKDANSFSCVVSLQLQVQTQSQSPAQPRNCILYTVYYTTFAQMPNYTVIQSVNYNTNKIQLPPEYCKSKRQVRQVQCCLLDLDFGS